MLGIYLKYRELFIIWKRVKIERLKMEGDDDNDEAAAS